VADLTPEALAGELEKHARGLRAEASRMDADGYFRPADSARQRADGLALAIEKVRELAPAHAALAEEAAGLRDANAQQRLALRRAAALHVAEDAILARYRAALEAALTILTDRSLTAASRRNQAEAAVRKGLEAS
jgi:hypothetical protein